MDLALADPSVPAPPAAEALAPTTPTTPTTLAELDRAVAALGAEARAFARTPPREKAALLRAVIPRLLEAAPAMAEAACRVAGLAPEGAAAAHAWLAGPVAAVAYARLLAEALEDIAATGRPALPVSAMERRADGRLYARLEPRTFVERAALLGREVGVLFAPGTEPEDVIAGQAAFYRLPEPEGGVAQVIAAGDDAGGGVLDALFALFVEGRVVLLDPGAPLGSTAAQALGPIVERGLVRVAPAGEAGRAHLAGHAGIAAVIAPPPGRAGPVIIVPCLYAKDDLAYLAQRLASEVAHGAGLGARVIVVHAGWPQRRLFLGLLERALAAVSPGLRVVASTAVEAPLPVAVAAVSLAAEDAVSYLGAAVAAANEHLAGALSAEIVVHPVHEDDPEVGPALWRAVGDLRCGAVGVNQWPAQLRFMAAPPWGGHPDVAGFRNNARMLARVDKAVLRGPLLPARRPAYLGGSEAGPRDAAQLAAFQATPRAGRLFAVAGR